MRSSHSRGASARPLILLALSASLALALTTPSSASTRPAAEHQTAATPARVKATNSLNSMGSRYVNTPIQIKGYTSGFHGRHKLVLQRFAPARHRWVARAKQRVVAGAYEFPAQYRSRPGVARYRTVLHLRHGQVRRSNVIAVRVLALPPAQPAPAPAPAPPPPPPPPAAQTCAQDPSQASCIKPVSSQPAGAMLPDLRIKDLTKCGAGDSAATGGTCFMIDTTSTPGTKLLKFGVITFNVGVGPGEIVATRSNSLATDWTAYQNFYDASGHLLGSMLDPGVQFYFAGDGHNHWHVRDFDAYDLLDATGTTLAHAEKHGYCMQDNTTYTPMVGLPGVSSDPVYAESTSCGKGLTGAVSIVHGLSRGWGDTYPTSLPDQAINITGLPDGEYTVRVHADAVGAVRESDETNNTAEVKVQIAGDTVSVVPGTSTGGLP